MSGFEKKHHHLIKKPQPIADQWMGECTCGDWRTTVSIYEIPDRDQMLAEIKRQHQIHIYASNLHESREGPKYGQ